MGCITSKGATIIETKSGHNLRPPVVSRGTSSREHVSLEDAEAREMAVRMERVKSWVQSIPELPIEERTNAMTNYISLKERDKEREKDMVKMNSSVRGNSVASLKRANSTEMQYTVKESLASASVQSPRSPEDSNSRSGERIKDAAKLDGSFTVPVSRTPTLGVVQEQSENLPDTQEDKAALGQLGTADRKMFEALKQIRNIVGSSGNLRKEFESMDTDGDQLISMEEFQFACAAMGTGLHESDVTEVFKLIDLNQNGQLEFEEFLEAFDNMGGMSASEFVVQQRGREGEDEVETSGANDQNLEAHKEIPDGDNENLEAGKKTPVDDTETRGTNNETPGT